MFVTRTEHNTRHVACDVTRFKEWVAEDMSLFELQQAFTAYLFPSFLQNVEEGTFDLLRRAG